MSHSREEMAAYRGGWYRINYGNGQVSEILLGAKEAREAMKACCDDQYYDLYRLQVYLGDGEWGLA